MRITVVENSKFLENKSIKWQSHEMPTYALIPDSKKF